MERNRPNLIVASVILVTSVLLIWALRIGDSIGTLLKGIVIALFIWALLESKEPVKLTQFLVKSFVVSCVITSIIWFVSEGSLSLVYSAFWGVWLVYTVFPRSLLPVAISLIIYGIFRARLRAWEILLSSWYVFIFAVQVAYNVWWGWCNGSRHASCPPSFFNCRRFHHCLRSNFRLWRDGRLTKRGRPNFLIEYEYQA